MTLEEKLPVSASDNYGYDKHILKKWTIFFAMVVLIFIFVLVSLGIGSTHIPVGDVFNALLRRGSETDMVKIWYHRMPRVLAAVVTGAGLSLCGCVMQNTLRNPLASPSTLGVASASVFGANFAIIVLGAGTSTNFVSADFMVNSPYVVSIMAFLCSTAITLLVVLLARSRGFSPEAIILAGVAISSIFAAGTTIIQFFARDTAIATAVFWTFGDLSRISWDEVMLLNVFTSIAIIYFYMMRWNYNAIANGNEVAKSLGVSVDRVVLPTLVIASLITALSISFMGMIGFIGLVGPQIMRRIVGEDHRFLIPASALAGALILLMADTMARTIIAPVALPVGAITSLLGGPMFLYILMKRENKSWQL